MRVAIIGTIDNTVGLQADAEILTRHLTSAGYTVTLIHWKAPRPSERFDLAIHLEILSDDKLDIAPRNILFVNPEWFFEKWVPKLRGIDIVACKTRDAQRIFDRLGARTFYTGFEARDQLDLSVPRERRFLHVAGLSRTKGTPALLEAWHKHRMPYPLTVVSYRQTLPPTPPNVTVLGRLPDGELRDLQNRCLFHIQPSLYEGFGHAPHESLSVGAVLAVTDAPPMIEMTGAWATMACRPGKRQHLAQLHNVHPDAIAGATEAMWLMQDEEVTEVGRRARAAYEAGVSFFRTALPHLLETLSSERGAL